MQLLSFVNIKAISKQVKLFVKNKISWIWCNFKSEEINVTFIRQILILKIPYIQTRTLHWITVDYWKNAREGRIKLLLFVLVERKVLRPRRCILVIKRFNIIYRNSVPLSMQYPQNESFLTIYYCKITKCWKCLFNSLFNTWLPVSSRYLYVIGKFDYLNIRYIQTVLKSHFDVIRWFVKRKRL